MYLYKNQDPGKSGLFHLIEMQYSGYLSNHFFIMFTQILFICLFVYFRLKGKNLSIASA